MLSFLATTTTANTTGNNDANDKTVTSRVQFLTFPFRHWRKHYTINPPNDTYHVIYLGNVLTIIAKGEECLEKPLSLIWHTYCNRKRTELPMKLTVTRSGLKAETKQQGITEYWSHRITYCLAPSNLPRVFCWVYKHEGKKMKPELRCHAALCKKPSDPYRIAQTLEHYLRAALQEYRREKLYRQNTRINAQTIGQPFTGPKRKLLLQTGSLNFRPPGGRSKSAPRLFDIDEENEYPEEQQEEYSDEDSLCYIESSVGADACSTNSLEETVEIPFCRQNSSRDSYGVKQRQHLIRKLCDKRRIGEEEQRNGSVTSDFSSSIDSAPSSISSDDGIQCTDSENRPLELRNGEKRLERETDTISEESGYHDFDDGFNSVITDGGDNDNCDRGNDDDDDDDDDDESEYDEQVTAL
ncbi:GH04568p, putative [Brugia malayi]|uniref:GH04568p, putative n=1 Tax=Brugia malayi TaxID=6279 RepID=A0A4E9FT57_BRUMA|nr:GH04568p, putative [Brugia malayi]VIO99700.1 GH04568p, putative [Brugia malayi]